MLEQIEGSRPWPGPWPCCRPEVVCAYPISPQTHIIEAIGALVKSGELSPCEFINVESEFAAMSVSIGASATGARAYTATASQGLLFMIEAVYNAAGLGLPIVMTLANRAIGAPINIWNDHSDAMAVRDAGWIQLFAETNQEAADLHVQAFRLAEELSLPVMVCMDGFILTHAVERVDLPDQEAVDAFLPPYEPRQVLDPADPVSIGAMVGPGGVRGGPLPRPSPPARRPRAHPRPRRRVRRSLRPRERRAWSTPTGPRTPTPWWWRSGRSSARSKTSPTTLRAAGERVGVVGITSVPAVPARGACATPWPAPGGSWSSRRRSASASAASSRPTSPWRSRRRPCPLHTVVAGLGGRPITRRAMARCSRPPPTASWTTSSSSTSTGGWSTGSGPASPPAGDRGHPPRTSSATCGTVARRIGEEAP